MLAGLRTIDDGNAVHFRHLVIGNQEIYRPLSFKDLESKGRIFRFPDYIAAFAQILSHYRPHIRIIIANEDSRLARLRNRSFRLEVGAFDRLTFSAGQPQVYPRPVAWRTVDLNRSPGLSCKAVHDRQSQARAAACLLRRKEGLEGAR